MVAPGVGGNSRFQVTGMIEWRQKSKPKKIPGPKFNPPKNPTLNFRAIKISRGTTQPGYAGIIRRNYHESSDCFEYSKKSLLKLTYPKKYMPKFFDPKKTRN